MKSKIFVVALLSTLLLSQCGVEEGKLCCLATYEGIVIAEIIHADSGQALVNKSVLAETWVENFEAWVSSGTRKTNDNGIVEIRVVDVIERKITRIRITFHESDKEYVFEKELDLILRHHEPYDVVEIQFEF